MKHVAQLSDSLKACDNRRARVGANVVHIEEYGVWVRVSVRRIVTRSAALVVWELPPPRSSLEQ